MKIFRGFEGLQFENFKLQKMKRGASELLAEFKDLDEPEKKKILAHFASPLDVCSNCDCLFECPKDWDDDLGKLRRELPSHTRCSLCFPDDKGTLCFDCAHKTIKDPITCPGPNCKKTFCGDHWKTLSHFKCSRFIEEDDWGEGCKSVMCSKKCAHFWPNRHHDDELICAECLQWEYDNYDP